MAFEVAAGYTNLPNGVFSPTIFSKKVQKAFRKESVVEAVTNSDYFGEIANFGDSVKIIKEPEVVINSLKRGTQIQTQDLEDSDFSLIVDQANYFAFQLDDIEKQQSHVEWMDMASNRAAYRMKDRYDTEVLGYLTGYTPTYNSSGSVSSWTARTAANGTASNEDADADELLGTLKLTAADFGGAGTDSIATGVAGTYVATPLEILNRMNRKLDLLNVPSDGRWLIIDPVFAEILMDENSKFINNDYNPGADQLTNGKLIEKQIRGFTVYKSNSLPFIGTGPGTIDTNGSAANYGVIMAGHKSAVATAQQLSKTEQYRNPNGFSDIVRGMHLYGRKILRPEGLIRAWYNINK